MGAKRPGQTLFQFSILGERVLVFGDRRGFLRYIGPTHFEAGEWCGIELDLPEGKNDGSIEGTDYFHCLPNHGLFVPSPYVELIKNVQPKKFSLCLRDIGKVHFSKKLAARWRS